MMKSNKITKLTTLSETKFLNLYEAQYENRIGNKKSWTIASRKDEEVLKERFFENKQDLEDAVVVAALHKPSDKLVIIKQFRVPINGFIYELTAGLIDSGEDAREAVKRELMEETGLQVKEIFEIKERLYLSPGMTDECVRLVYCTCEGEISDENLEEDENIEAMLISQEEAAQIIESGENIDIKCYLLLKDFALYGAEIFEGKNNILK